MERAKSTFGSNDGVAQKVLIFAGDAIGDVLVEKYPDDFAPLFEEGDVFVKGTNATASVTPVCFATIFTGAPPEVHGIKVYERPVLKVETIFDVFAESGKKVAIVAEKTRGVALIFRERKIDYYATETDKEAFEVAKKLLKESDYDFILRYDGGYDAAMHKNGVDAPESLAAMRTSVARALELAAPADEVWAGYDRAYAFISDRGSHDDANGYGTHGSNAADDVIVDCLYRLRKAR